MLIRNQRRPAFTLVELMVAAALVVLIMSILAFAFSAASESLGHLKAVGGLAERLRIAQDKLRTDLEAPHFVTGDSPGVLKLSDIRYDLLTPGGTNVLPPQGGYFRIEQGSGSIFEGLDSDGNFSTRAANHSFEMTVKREGKSADDLFVIPAPGWAGPFPFSVTDTPLDPNLVAFNWARVRWQLGNPQTIDNVQTFTLYRMVRVVAPRQGIGVPDTVNGPELISMTTLPVIDPSSANAMVDLAYPTTRSRSPIAPYPSTSPRFGDDIVMTNVLSFEVKPAFVSASGVQQSRTVDTNPGIGSPIPNTSTPNLTQTPQTISNADYPFDDLPPVTENTGLAGQRLFDTWTDQLAGWNTPGGANSFPLRARVNALQIKIRVYDIKTKLTRQATLIVKM